MTLEPGARSGQHQSGVALLLAIWVLTLLAVIAGEFMTSGRVRAAAEHNKRDDLLGLSLALAGYQAAKAALDVELDKISIDESDQLLLHYKGVTDPVPAVMTDVPLGGGTYSWRISVEGGLVNINKATPTLIANLLQQCGMGPGTERDTVVDSILDWRDKNREHHLNGAEEDYYRGLDPPYSCKDGPFDVVEELLLVRGVTPKLFAGGEADGKKVPGLRDLVTPYDVIINKDLEPKDVREALGHAWSGKRVNPSEHLVIIATGKPAGSGPPRSLRAVVRRERDEAGSLTFTLVYYNDMYIPE
jgi:general secretion pathway protein K